LKEHLKINPKADISMQTEGRMMPGMSKKNVDCTILIFVSRTGWQFNPPCCCCWWWLYKTP